MRKSFCQAMLQHASREDFVFLTGDLGFMALEPLQQAMGRRFINAGVAEQNMVSVAAGLARNQMRAWAYSIAPFIYARPYEQIRNDVCLHRLPVVLVGNGGGYGYGVQGATHHAIEDYGSLLCFGGMQAYIPAFEADVAQIVAQLMETKDPSYLRLGLGEEPKDAALPAFAPMRKLLDAGGANGATILAVGPLAGGLFAAARSLDAPSRPNLWVLSQLPFTTLNDEFLADVARTGHLIVVEEHVAQGSAGLALAQHLLVRGLAPRRFSHRHALGYPSARYGSQAFHRK